uniref:Uncharacterized protein n=1 Tax=Arundo donax TaxID=35708 RepID=A0A0A8Z7F5_ARUDO
MKTITFAAYMISKPI